MKRHMTDNTRFGDRTPRPENSGDGLSRRDFLRVSGVAGALAVTESSGAGGIGAPARAGQPASAGADDFPLAETTIADLQEGLASGEWTTRSLAEAYLSRIEQIDGRGPTLRSVLETNPDALAIADRLDRERGEGRLRGPLHGIPVLLKDNIDTADRMTTTAGSLALAGWVPPEDSGVAARLRQAGALLLGKTNLSEWANFRSTRSSSGWSGRGGQCRNPYVLDRNPCGSSSGSGAAVSANLAAAAIGTETDGSIVCPSTANGIVGIKPTVGLVSRAGVIPISHTQDTAGPMARTVRDAAVVLGVLAGPDPRDPATAAHTQDTAGPMARTVRDAAVVLGVLAGPDPRDPATAASDTRGLADYTPFLDPAGLRDARIGVARQFLGFHAGVELVVEQAIDAMRAAGAVVVDPVVLGPGAGRSLQMAETDVLFYEFKAGLNGYLARRGSGAEVRSLAELIAFNERNAETEMPYFGQERLIAAEAKGPLSEPAYLMALATARRLSRADGIDRTMDEHRLDAIVGPTGGPAWVTDLVNGDHFGGSSSAYPAAAGYPNITVPAGAVHGLPVGLSFFGRAWSEPTLVRIAYAFEQTTQARRAPRFRPTIG